MAGERYVALGLAGVRSAWFTEVLRWSTVGSIPVEFVKCISAEELRARLASGRPFSVVLIDAGTGAVDRDLLDLASAHEVSVVVVDDGRSTRDWMAIGVRGVLPATFNRDQLLETLEHTSRMIGGATALPVEDPGDVPAAAARRGRLVAVTGPGGTGASTAAIALAQAFGDDPALGGQVALADLRLSADLAMLHDARDVVPGVQELVEAHRSARPALEQVRSLTFHVVNRRYHLLLGLRRHRDWTVLRPRSFEAAVEGLRRAFPVVVADIDVDLEGERECGSVDVEERNLMARSITARADAVVVVGTPGVKGLHSLVRVVNELRDHSVEPQRILAVVNQAGRNQRARSELTRSFADLTGAGRGTAPVVGPVFLPERRGLDELHRDGARLPSQLTGPLRGAVRAVLDRAPEAVTTASEPVAVVPGSLGSWADQEAASS